MPGETFGSKITPTLTSGPGADSATSPGPHDALEELVSRWESLRDGGGPNAPVAVLQDEFLTILSLARKGLTAPSPAPSPGPQDVRDKIARELFGFIADQGITLDGELRDAILPVIIDALRRAALAQSDAQPRWPDIDAAQRRTYTQSDAQPVGFWRYKGERLWRECNEAEYHVLGDNPEDVERRLLYTTPPSLPEGAQPSSAGLIEAADHCRKRAEYFDRTKGHFDREDAARSYRATAKELEGLARTRAADRSAT